MTSAGSAAAGQPASRRPASTASLLGGLALQLGAELGEPVQRGVDADEGELALDDGEVGAPDVDEDPAQVVGVVVPALARRAGAVAATPGGEQDDRRALEQPGAPGRPATTRSIQVFTCGETPEL